MLQRIMWEGRILPGKCEEYIERHTHIWPEMVENLKLQGIRNYSIFLSGDRVFGYYECEDLETRDAVKAVNEAQKRWTEVMREVADFSQPHSFRQVFYLE